MRDERQTLDQALSLHEKGDVAGAAKLYRRIIDRNPRNLQALHFLGVAEAAAGNIERAKSLINRSLQSDAVNVQFIENYAAILHRAAEHDDLIRLCAHGLRFAPNSAILLQANAAALIALQRHAAAIEPLQKLVAGFPDQFQAHFMLGLALAKQRQYDTALAAYDHALRLNPSFAEAHLNKGTIHFANRRFAAALDAYDQALVLRPGYPGAHLGRGYALLQLRRQQDALAAIDRALALQPDFADAWTGRGNALLDLARLPEAAAAYDRALTIRPQLAAAWSGHGNILLRSGRHRDAEAAFARAIDADAAFAEAWLGRGTLALSLGRHRETVEALDRALDVNPGLVAAWTVRGQACYLEKRYDDALASWSQALALDPDQPAIVAACHRIRSHHCDWAGFEASCAAIRQAVRDGHAVAPFTFVAIASTPAEQLQCARSWIAGSLGSTAAAPPVASYRHDRIRIGYLSADFHQHATAQLMAGVFEHHDRSRFEVTALSIGPDDNSTMRRRITAAFERFVDLRAEGDDQAAALIRQLEIDILVDLKGYTQDARTGILAMRPAPIQVNYLGFPGTIGAGFIDYIIADRHVIPEQDFDHYAEKVVWLPNSYQANDTRRAIADHPAHRARHGLPEQAFVFCCFNDNYKITPDVFDGWMRILAAVEDGVLWLYEDNAVAAENLRREAAARGIDRDRLIFARRVDPDEHLARHRCADLFLDTLPYGAHTTASDALWSGLPVLSRLGESFAGRVGASLLHAIGLPELVVTTAAAYEQLAIELARNPGRLAELKARLDRNRPVAPLFDTAGFTRDLEQAYAAMLHRQQAGTPPGHIVVPAPAIGNQQGAR